ATRPSCALSPYTTLFRSIDDVPDPQVGPGQVEVSVDWCGICGTDLHEFLEGPIFIPAEGSPHPLTGSEPPVVMGHEFAGVVSRRSEEHTSELQSREKLVS